MGDLTNRELQLLDSVVEFNSKRLIGGRKRLGDPIIEVLLGQLADSRRDVLDRVRLLRRRLLAFDADSDLLLRGALRRLFAGLGRGFPLA